MSAYRPFVERAHGNDDGTAMFDEGGNKEEVLLPFARDEFCLFSARFLILSCFMY
jgi:hypothetical protein